MIFPPVFSFLSGILRSRTPDYNLFFVRLPNMIPRIDAAALLDAHHKDHGSAMQSVRGAVADVGFLTLYNTPILPQMVAEALSSYRAFFALPAAKKAQYDMASTGYNRGWGAPQSEQVDLAANPDYKQFFDSGFELDPDDPLRALNLPIYAPNLWPDTPPDFAPTLRDYYAKACSFALDLLRAVAFAIGERGDYFDDKFTRPMALLRGNFYPPRPANAGPQDFGIAAHTDYGCLTLLATDGTPGLEVRKRGGGWLPVSAPVGEFIINFGEMLEMWTARRVVATPHRVVGMHAERLSIPLFFNPNFDVNVAPIGSDTAILAGDHLQKRFSQTYVHLQNSPTAGVRSP
jgi:isopenicillin N synthase-like dioxygenase